MGRKQAREGTMQLLFQMETINDFSEEVLNTFLDNFTFDEMESKYINHSIYKIKENLNIIDRYIEQNLKGWSIDRLASVDLAVLRIAIYEILYRQDIPIEVSINEAIEIVKKFSNDDSFKFINGVLGGVVNSLKK
ncbi:MAG TPA: transcription antitermination factor NusB [Tissierellaceae bacterium]|nr:transcription antitermination factor NusB [Tissierellaceae bacterium]